MSLSLNEVRNLPHFFYTPSFNSINDTNLRSDDARDLLLTAPIGVYYFMSDMKNMNKIVAIVQIGDKYEAYSCVEKFIFPLVQVQHYKLKELEKYMAEKVLKDKQETLDFYTDEAKKYPTAKKIKTILTKQIEQFKMQPITDWIKGENFSLNCVINEGLKNKIVSFLETPATPHKETEFSAKNLANSMRKGPYKPMEEKSNELTPLLGQHFLQT